MHLTYFPDMLIYAEISVIHCVDITNLTVGRHTIDLSVENIFSSNSVTYLFNLTPLKVRDICVVLVLCTVNKYESDYLTQKGK